MYIDRREQHKYPKDSNNNNNNKKRELSPLLLLLLSQQSQTEQKTEIYLYMYDTFSTLSSHGLSLSLTLSLPHSLCLTHCVSPVWAAFHGREVALTRE